MSVNYKLYNDSGMPGYKLLNSGDLILNVAVGLTMRIFGDLAARLSYEVRHDTSPGDDNKRDGYHRLGLDRL